MTGLYKQNDQVMYSYTGQTSMRPQRFLLRDPHDMIRLSDTRKITAAFTLRGGCY